MHAPKLLLLGICLDFYPSLLYVSFTDLSCDAGTNAVLKLKSYFGYSSVIILFILVVYTLRQSPFWSMEGSEPLQVHISCLMFPLCASANTGFPMLSFPIVMIIAWASDQNQKDFSMFALCRVPTMWLLS